MSGAKLDATPESLGYRLMTDKELSNCTGCDCANCAQPKVFGSNWLADHSEINLCRFACPRPFVKLPAKPTPKPMKWEPVDLLNGSHRTISNGPWYDRLLEAQDTINKQGREIVRLKNQARKAKA
jgi:hypothetical protein